jgi:hypothetical protein
LKGRNPFSGFSKANVYGQNLVDSRLENGFLGKEMDALTFWKTTTMDKANLLEGLIDLLNQHGISYCVIGGQAVNAYVDPLVSLDLDLVVALDQLDEAAALLDEAFDVREFPHSLNVSLPDSDLRVQIQTDPRYGEFVSRARLHDVLGLRLPVAAVEDVLRGKVWAASDWTCRPSKRQKDLADIARLLEAYPELTVLVPPDIQARLV